MREWWWGRVEVRGWCVDVEVTRRALESSRCGNGGRLLLAASKHTPLTCIIVRVYWCYYLRVAMVVVQVKTFVFVAVVVLVVCCYLSRLASKGSTRQRIFHSPAQSPQLVTIEIWERCSTNSHGRREHVKIHTLSRHTRVSWTSVKANK